MSKLISLEAENFKRLKAVRLEPSETGVTIIAGRNAQGKSSVLDAIQAAIGGKKVTPRRPVRDGEEKSTIVAELDDLIVRRTFTASGGTLTVTDTSGAKIGKPQQVLDRLFGALTFDPLEFARMKPSEQAEEVKRVAGLDLSELENKRDTAYQSRRDAKVLLKDRDGHLASFGSKPEKVERADTEKLSERLRDVRRREEKLAHLEANKSRHREDYDAIKGKIVRLQEELEMITAAGKEANEQIVAVKAEIEQGESADDLAKQFDSINEINSDAQRWEEYQSALRLRDEQKEVVNKFEIELKTARESIDQKIAAVELPVSDMTISDGELLLNDVPFAQASQAEQIKASVEMGIGANPELKLILVRDGSLFDTDNLQLLAEIAERHDVQVLVERVGADGDTGVIIEDGEIKSTLSG